MTEIVKVKDNIIVEHSFVNRALHDDEIQVTKEFTANIGDRVDENLNVVVALVESEDTAPAPAVVIDTVQAVIEDVVEEEEPEQETIEDLDVFVLTKTDELMIQLQEIDFSSIRAIRAILSGTASEDDHKTLTALEKQAINLRKELADTEH